MNAAPSAGSRPKAAQPRPDKEKAEPPPRLTSADLRGEFRSWAADLSSQLRRDVREELQNFLVEFSEKSLHSNGLPPEEPATPSQPSRPSGYFPKVSRTSERKFTSTLALSMAGEAEPHEWSKRNLLTANATRIANDMRPVDEYGLPIAHHKLHHHHRHLLAGAHSDDSLPGTPREHVPFMAGEKWDEADDRPPDHHHYHYHGGHDVFRFRLESGETYMDDSSRQESGLPDHDDVIGKPDAGWRVVAHRLIRNHVLETVVGVSVLVNIVVIGVETEFKARHMDERELFSFWVVDVTFCGFYISELLLRFLVYGWKLFRGEDWSWNVFDIATVSLQVVDCASGFCEQFLGGVNVGFLRVIRLMRLVRITRIIRAFRLIEELRTIVACILGSMKSLAWCLLFILAMSYTFAILLTQIILEQKVKNGVEEFSEELEYWWGSLSRTILTLYECIASGVSWDDAVHPLMRDISPVVGVILCLYIAFSVIAMMNIVTAVFVEKVLENAQKVQDEYMATHITDAFKRSDADNSGIITWDEFQSNLGTPELMEYFKIIDVDISEAQGLFRLLDVDCSGEVDAIEFVSGCVRLRGPAKAIELSLLMHESRRMNDWLTSNVTYIGSLLEHLAYGDGKEAAVTLLNGGGGVLHQE
eukprot:TRINITY_DN19869_c0_g2_i1.p1 TRINITY_DN19869_c0_g2~~TRINITY_DN19869_c0_g2_i1.p1  ORF type:complete len:644 (-),score=143.90 TRINITY_DN19869_c0_g2_i1:267-2198(-)